MINSVYICEKALINLMALHNQNNEAPDVKRVMINWGIAKRCPHIQERFSLLEVFSFVFLEFTLPESLSKKEKKISCKKSSTESESEEVQWKPENNENECFSGREQGYPRWKDEAITILQWMWPWRHLSCEGYLSLPFPFSLFLL
jgi:hypothetical protein